MHPGTMLTDAIRAWATPQVASAGVVTDSPSPSPSGSKVQVHLGSQAIAADFPTPTAARYGSSQNGINGKGGEFERPSAGTPSLFTLAANGDLPSRPDPEIAKHGRASSSSARMLNPLFVEMLMGWPTGWTDCEAAATESYRRWLLSHGEYSCALIESWPSPTASWATPADVVQAQYAGADADRPSYAAATEIAAAEWPTPMAVDGKRGGDSVYKRGNPALSLASRNFMLDTNFAVDADESNSEDASMAVVTLNYNEPVERRAPEVVLGLPDSGPSARGSTFWRRPQLCPREHFLANTVGLAPVRRADPLDVGLVWHYALEAYYRGIMAMQQHQPVDVAPDIAAFEVLKPFASEPGWVDFHRQLASMLDSYLDRYHDVEKDTWEIIAVEETLAVGLEHGFGFEYSSRFDLWIIDHSLRQRVTRIIEHKSASSLDSNTITGYLLDQQVLGQVWLGEHCLDHDAYPPFMGSYVNITTKPKSQTGKGSVPEHIRLPIAQNPTILASWEESMRYWQKQRDAIDAEASFPRNFSACRRAYGRCQFFNLCQGFTDVRPSDLVQLRQKPETAGVHMPTGYRFANQWDEETT